MAGPGAAGADTALLPGHGLQCGGGGRHVPLGALLGTLVLGNIPTVVLLAIYVACREKQRKRSELDKMEIDDL